MFSNVGLLFLIFWLIVYYLCVGIWIGFLFWFWLFFFYCLLCGKVKFVCYFLLCFLGVCCFNIFVMYMFFWFCWVDICLVCFCWDIVVLLVLWNCFWNINFFLKRLVGVYFWLCILVSGWFCCVVCWYFVDLLDCFLMVLLVLVVGKKIWLIMLMMFYLRLCGFVFLILWV